MLLQFVTFFATHFSCWLIAVFAQSFRSFYFTTLLHSHRNANPTQELSFIRSFRSISLQSLSGVYVFSHANILVVAALFRFTPQSFTTAHIHPLSFFSLPFHYIHSLLPALAFSNANVRAKKCAKLAAGSTQPPRSALPVSGAFAPLAAARTQRTGLILRSVSLLSHLSLAINAGSRLFLPFFGLNLLLPRQPPTTHP